MGKIVGMGATPKKTDSDGAAKKENALLKKANEKLAKENEELLAKLDEASTYAENADHKIAELSAYAENADHKIAELSEQLAALEALQKPE